MKELHPHIKWRGAISNLILGISDGMVVSLAFLTGISLNLANPKIIILTGVASIIANTVSMFFSGVLATRTEIDLFKADYERELYEIENEPEEEQQEMVGFYARKGLSASDARKIVSKIIKDKTKWLEDMLLNELHIHEDTLGSPLQAGAAIGFSSLVGGLIPLAPYLLIGSLPTAINTSIITSFSSLFVIGAIKGGIAKRNLIVSGCEMLLIGMIASLIVFEVGKALVFA